METVLSLDLLTEVDRKRDHKVYTKDMVTDDDSTMWSHCQNKNNGGKSPNHIPQPNYLADPSHRFKVMVKPFFRMVNTAKYPTRCKNIAFLRLEKYTSCFMNQNRNMSLDDFVK